MQYLPFCQASEVPKSMATLFVRECSCYLVTHSSQVAEMKILLPCFQPGSLLFSSGELEKWKLTFCLVWITDGRLLQLAPESMHENLGCGHFFHTQEGKGRALKKKIFFSLSMGKSGSCPSAQSVRSRMFSGKSAQPHNFIRSCTLQEMCIVPFFSNCHPQILI